MEFTTGKPYPLRTGFLLEGTLMEILPDTIILTYFLENPTIEEKHDFQKGNTDFRFLVEGDILFFLSKIGGMEWADAPFHQPLNKENRLQDYPEVGKGFSVTMVLVNTETGLIEGMRMKALTHQQSISLVDAIKAQKRLSDYDRELDLIYLKYPLSSSMASNSTF